MGLGLLDTVLLVISGIVVTLFVPFVFPSGWDIGKHGNHMSTWTVDSQVVKIMCCQLTGAGVGQRSGYTMLRAYHYSTSVRSVYIPLVHIFGVVHSGHTNLVF